VGTYGIESIEDPDAPFSKILGKAQVIDTVRFPRMTLHIRSGDCDDSTALLGSLLESSGISTAIMTSPGHVFLAFDTSEPTENNWLFDAEGYVSLARNGTIWLPVETTTLDRGFLESWRIASSLVIDNPEGIEFLPVLEQRDLYPPLPLPESTITVIEPQREEIDRLLSVSMDGTISLLYESGVKALESALKEARGRKELKIRNQLGVLHARFGQMREAESAFEHNMREDPSYTASYLNLANLMVRERRDEEAVSALRGGLERNPRSPTLNLLMARIYHAQGKYREAWRHFDTVKQTSHELAERYAYLGDGGDNTRRAGIDWENSPVIWDEGEE
jgi:tetratricopeptide (TPR) repeat protein